MIDGKQAWIIPAIVFTFSIFLYGCGGPQQLNATLAPTAEIFFNAYPYLDIKEITLEFSDDKTECPNIRVDNSLWRASNGATKQNLVVCQLEKCLYVVSLNCFIFNSGY